MFTRAKAFAARNKEVFARAGAIGLVTAVVGAQVLHTQRRANEKAEATRKDILDTIDNHFAKDK